MSRRTHRRARRQRVTESLWKNLDRAEKGVLTQPGKASEFIDHLKAYCGSHLILAVVLYLRVSSGPQEHRGNLLTQEWKLRRACKKYGIPIVAVFKETCSGRVVVEARAALIAAAECARKHEAETGVHTVVLALSVDRLVRSRDYHSVHSLNAIPAKREFIKLDKLTDGVTLVTGLHPNMPPPKVRGCYTRLGQRFKGRKGGGDRKPGWTKRRREKKLPLVRHLLKQGMNVTDIARHEEIKVPRSTVTDWLKEYEL